MLAFESPLVDESTFSYKFLRRLDTVMTFIFTIEVIVKVIAKGFLFNGKKSYLRDPGNILDLFIVVVAVFSEFNTESNLSFVKIIRMAKLARPMRLIFRN